MASRYEVEVTITSAKDLKNVNWRHGELKPYAVVWVDPKTKCSTSVADGGDTAPYWNQKLLIPFNSPIEESTLHVDIVHAEAAEDTKPLIGSARLPLRDVLDDVGLGGRVDRTLQLKRPSGRPHGKVDVAVSVREPGYRAPPEPYYAAPYAVPPPAGSRDYPAPPYAGTYGAAPQPAYAAAPSGYPAYGAPPSYGQAAYGQSSYYGQGVGEYGQGQQGGYVEEKKSSKFGGMGTGLAVGAVAGVLGGIALTEGVDAIEDHVADDVEDDLGYDEDDF